MDNFKKIGKSNLTKIRSRIFYLKNVWSRYQTHAKIIQIIPAETQSILDYFALSYCETTEEVFTTTLDHITDCLEELELFVSPNETFANLSSRSDSFSAFSLSHFPPIKLSPFDGNYNE